MTDEEFFIFLDERVRINIIFLFVIDSDISLMKRVEHLKNLK